MSTDLSLVNSFSSLHLPRAAAFLGVLLAGEAFSSDIGGDIAGPVASGFSATLAERVGGRLKHR